LSSSLKEIVTVRKSVLGAARGSIAAERDAGFQCAG
jgi:hypothetical protein